MKNFIFTSLFLLFCQNLMEAQTDNDTTIHAFSDIMPFIIVKTCDPNLHQGWTLDSVRSCADKQLMALLAQNIRYPEPAREGNVQGTVVTQFVVEKTGKMTNHKVLKDIGSGCGDEAIRVLKALDEAGMRWIPGQSDGKVRRTVVSLPIRFKIEESKPYVISELGDTIFVEFEKTASFRGGFDSLANFIYANTIYPKNHADSCGTGIVEMAFTIFPNGKTRLDNQLDFSNLGPDFQYNAIRLFNKSSGFWEPAEHQGKKVATTTSIRVPFKSPAKGCVLQNENFDKAILLAEESMNLEESGNPDASISKISEAIKLLPRNTEFYYFRGNLLLNQNKKEEACADFSMIKSILGTTWFEQMGTILCGW